MVVVLPTGVLIVHADATTAALGNGSMEFDSFDRVEIPANFEEAPIDDLVQLIGSPRPLSPIFSPLTASF